MAHTDRLHLYLAWAYVVLRIAHTSIQCTLNIVMWRFSMFALSALVLMIMAGREIAALF